VLASRCSAFLLHRQHGTWALAESAATAAAKKRQEEEETAAGIAAVELFKQQEELETRAWAEADGEVANGEGNAEAEVIVVDSD
jgi:hypothetical protein